MANRGRGTLTVRRSDNPFFQPSSQTVGEDFSEEIVYNAPTVERVGRPKKLEDDYEFGFLYKRASEDIGRGIDPSDSRLSRAMAQGDTLRDIAKMKTGGIEKPTGDDDGAPELSGTMRAERILDRYHHEQEKGDSRSLQHECSARDRSGNSIHASRALREMIARPKISRNEWKTTEI